MTDEILKTIVIHLARAKAALSEITSWDNLDASVFKDFQKVKTVDTFIFRFIKLQDAMGEKLFKSFLDEIGDYQDYMSMIDVLDKLEKLRIIDNVRNWTKYRKLRNKLAHEYPDNEDSIVEGIKASMQVFDYFEQILSRISNYRQERGLGKYWIDYHE